MSVERTLSFSGPTRRVPQALVAAGLVLGGLLLAESLYYVFHPGLLTLEFLVGALSSLPFVLGLVGGGYWLRRSDLSVERYGRIGGWCLVGLAVFLVVNLSLMVAVPPGNSIVLAGWLRWAVGLGAGTGLLIGVFEARAIEREAAAQRAAVRAEESHARQELLDYLNSLLRHEVLNSANVIDGYAARLVGEHDVHDEAREDVAVIRSEADELACTLQDVRILLDAARDADDLERMDLGDVLTAEARKLRRRYETETETSVPRGTYVLADPLVKRLFANLLSNAVEHNDGDSPRVSVTVETTPDVVSVRVADNGPGVPADERDSLFVPESSGSPDHGLGLVIVDALARRYGGSVELAETGPDGSAFVVELPAASAAGDAAPPRA